VEEGDGTSGVTMPAGIEAVAEEDTLAELIEKQSLLMTDP
jgi:hypothetical protein